MQAKKNRNVFVVGGKRVPFVRSWTQYSRTSNQEMLTHSLSELVSAFGLRGKKLGDVGLGAVMLHPFDWNLAREVVLGTGLNPDTPAFNLQRACGTSLEIASIIALKIAAGQIDVGVAGGADTNSDLPAAFPREFAWKVLELRKAKATSEKIKRLLAFGAKDLKPQFPDVVEPRTRLSMGQHCERMVQEWKISREAQDEWALKSHQGGVKGYQEGFYSDLVVPFKGVKQDGTLRADTSIEKLKKLPPAFDAPGNRTLTAGNSSPLTDGAAVVLLSSEEYAKANHLPMLARFVDAEVAALDFVKGEGLLMAPTIAVSELLKRNNLKLQDFDFYEIHEAFAGQVLCTLKAWESPEFCQQRLGRSEPLGSIPKEKINLKGGSVALGHPFAATGARIVAGLAKMIHQKGSGRGLISVCTAGGMGVAAILDK